MDTLAALAALCFGWLLRLALPITITFVLGYFLHRLDARWQAEAQLASVPVQKPDCWQIKGCSPEERQECVAFSSPLPCWQVFRRPNAYLREECLTCKVFIDAPTPTLPSAVSISKLEG